MPSIRIGKVVRTRSCFRRSCAMGRCILEKWVSTGLAITALVIGTAPTLLESALTAPAGWVASIARPAQTALCPSARRDTLAAASQQTWRIDDWENDWLLNYGNLRR